MGYKLQVVIDFAHYMGLGILGSSNIHLWH
jgi:hypothetical protein